MRKLFSMRYGKALSEKKISFPRIPRPLRNRLSDTIRQNDDTVTDRWGSYTSISSEAFDHLRGCLGARQVRVYAEERAEPTAQSIYKVVEGGWGPNVFDAIEAFADQVTDPKFEREVNAAFSASDSPFRLLHGCVLKVDSEWLHHETVANAISLLSGAAFPGPLEEFQAAITALEAGDTKEAIAQANRSLESVEKAILEVDSEKPGKLLRLLIDSGIVPPYCNGFLECFEKLMSAVASIRNDAPGAGHGQGAERTEIPRSVAELMLHTTGTIIVFLIKRYAESRQGESAAR